MARLSSLTSKSLQNLFHRLLNVTANVPVFCLVYSLQEYQSTAEAFLGQLQSLAGVFPEKLQVVCVFDDGFRDEQSLNPSNHPDCVANPGFFESYRAHVINLTTHRLIRERPQWHLRKCSMMRKLQEIPTPYLTGLAQIGWDGIADSHQAMSAMGQLSQILPTSLEEWYDSTYKKLQDPENCWVRAAVRWVAQAARPLKATELAVAVALSQPGATGSMEMLRDYISCDIVKDISRIVGPIIQSSPDDVSFRDGCCSALAERFAESADHEILLTACLDYLELLLLSVTDTDSSNLRLPELELVEYATLCWPHHFKEGTSDNAVTRVSSFFLHKEQCRAWSRWYNKLGNSHQFDGEAETVPFELACRFGLVPLVNHYLPTTKALDSAQSSLQHALDLAARYRHDQTIKCLLGAGAASSQALGLAVQAESASAVAELIQVKSSINMIDEHGYAPLHYAVTAGSLDITALLLNHGAAVDQASRDGLTALHLAAMAGHLAITELLLQADASVSLLNASGYDALKCAAQTGSHEIVSLLISRGVDANVPAEDGNTALHLAVEVGDPASIFRLLDETSIVNTRNCSGYTPAGLASRSGNLLVLQKLMERDAQPIAATNIGSDDASIQGTFRLSDENEFSLLALAAQNGRIEVVKWLLQCDMTQSEACGAAIYHAAARGDTPVLIELLQHEGCEHWPVAQNAEGCTALHLAVKHGYKDVVTELLKSIQSAINIVDDKKWTTLHQAAASGNLSVTEALIARGAKLAAKDTDGRTSVHIAARNGHLEVLRYLQALAPGDRLRDVNGDTPLSLAVRKGHTKIVSELLTTDMASAPKQHNYPFHIASQQGHTDLVQLFIDQKWNVNEGDEDGATPLHHAAIGGSVSVAHMLIKAGAKVNATDSSSWSPLFEAAAGGHAQLARVLVDAGADINAEDRWQETPLYRAAFNRALTVVKVLLESSSTLDLNQKNFQGWTALHAAYDSVDIIRLLLDTGADPFIQDTNHETPLVVAGNRGYPDTCKVLLQVVIDKALQNPALHTSALHQIAAVGEIEPLKLLLEHGVHCDASDGDGTTALLLACLYGQNDSVKLLIEHGADIERISSRCGTPLTAAVEGGHAEIVRILLDKGVDVYKTTGERGSALHLAIENQDSDVVELLLTQASPNLDVPGHPSPLHCAVQQNNLLSIKALIRAGADLTVRDPEGRTLLIVAFLWHAGEAAEILLEQEDVELNAQDLAGQTALIAAINRTGEGEAVLDLLTRKADPEIADGEGKTALVHAIRKGYLPHIQQLLAHDANLATVDARGRNPLYWACLADNEEIFDTVLCAMQNHPESDSLLAAAVGAAVTVNRIDFLKSLLDNANVLPNLPDSNGWSPLYTARQLRLTEIETELLQAGASDGSSFQLPHQPAQFHQQDKHPCLQVDDDGMGVNVRGK
jgi:ankyrin repeat protein